MTVVTMPDGAQVDFGDLPPDQIRALIQEKFPDAAAGVSAPAGAPKMGAVEDIARSTATGLGEGLTGSVGLLGDVQGVMDSFGTWVGDQLGLKPLPPEAAAGFKRDNAPTTADIEAATGFDQRKHTPQTTAGEFFRTGASFAGPAAVSGIGRGVVRSAVKYGAVPGVVSEGAGQLTEGTDLEPAARVLGGLGGMGVMAFMSRPTTAAAALKRAMPEGVTGNDIMKADSLMASARRQGMQLTWPEALHKVTEGRVDITGLQRILEQTTGGSKTLGPMMADRPAQIARGMSDTMSDLSAGARMTSPEAAGLSVQRTAKEGLDAIRKRINAIAEPYYKASAGTRIPSRQFQQLQGDPLYQDALAAVRSDPIHSRFIAGLPDDAVGVQNEVKKYFDRLADRAAPMNDQTAASVYGNVGRNVRDTAKAASPDYERALGLESDLRRQILNPAEKGPLGAFAKLDDIRAQGRALLTSAPAEGSERAVAETMRLLSRRAPDEALQLVRTHLRGVFDETAQGLISGGNQWGGAKFAAEIRGNSQQAKNLEAAVRALPNGAERWEGLNAFLDVLEATGRRQRPGSLTAFNQQALEDLKRGSLPAEAAKTARSLGARLGDFYDQWKLGKISAELANIITDPRSGKMLAGLAAAKTARQRQDIAGALVTYYATEPARQQTKQPAEPVKD